METPPLSPRGPHKTPSKDLEEKGLVDKVVDWVQSLFGEERVKERQEEYREEGGLIVQQPETEIEAREVIKPGEFRTLGLEIPEDAFSEEIMDEFDARVYEEHKADWKVIFDKMESAAFKKRVSFDFKREKYEGNPALFIADIGSQPHVVKVFNYFVNLDDDFRDAWENIKDAREIYFNDMMNAYFEDQPEYLENLKRYNQLNDIRNQAIDALEEGDYTLEDKLNKQWKTKEYERLVAYFHEKRTMFINRLTIQYHERDRKFQYSLKMIENAKREIQEDYPDEVENPEFMREKIREKYQANNASNEFQRAFDYISRQEALMHTLFYVEYGAEERREKLTIVAPRFDFVKIGREVIGASHYAYAHSFIKDYPGIILTPTVGLTAMVLASPIAVPAGAVAGVFLWHLGKKAIQPIHKQWTESGMDIERAKEEREIKMPYLHSIFGFPITDKAKASMLKDLYENGLLFEEDFKDIDDNVKNEFLKAVHLKDIKDEKGYILSLAEVTKRREPHLRVLADVYATDTMKVNALEGLYKMGLLFKSDVDPELIDVAVKNTFLSKEKITENDLKDLSKLREFRNASFF